MEQNIWKSFKNFSKEALEAVSFSLTAKLKIPGNLFLTKFLHHWPKLQRQILGTGKHFDLALVSDSGRKHLCHRAVVCGMLVNNIFIIVFNITCIDENIHIRTNQSVINQSNQVFEAYALTASYNPNHPEGIKDSIVYFRTC